MSPMLIALYSPVMQSGKSEVAKVLQSVCNFKLVKFADPVKDMVRGLLVQTGAPESTIERMLEGDLKEETIPGLGRSTRYLLQTLGTDWGRTTISDNLWVSLAMQRLQDCLSRGQHVVIDDMRFPNEFRAVTQLGGRCVRIHRASALPYAAHKSEGLLDNYPMMQLENNGTLDQLHYAASILPDLLRD